MTEAQIQASIVAYLKAVVPHGVVMAIPNAAVRRRGGRAGNAVPGLTKGAPDLLLTVAGRAYFLEVKTPRGKVSDDQRHVHQCLQVAGAGTAVVNSVDQTRVALAAWNIKTREAAPVARPVA